MSVDERQTARMRLAARARLRARQQAVAAGPMTELERAELLRVMRPTSASIALSQVIDQLGAARARRTGRFSPARSLEGRSYSAADDDSGQTSLLRSRAYVDPSGTANAPR